MKVLALNCGSSSLKFRLVGVPQKGGDQAVLSMVIGGEVKGIGGRSSLHLTIGDAAPQQTKGAVRHHQQAVQWAFEQLAGQTIDAVGHRVVHGGESFVESVRIDTHVHQHAGVGFIVFRLLHLTGGVVGFSAGQFKDLAVYENVSVAFAVWPIAVFYIVAMGALCLHLPSPLPTVKRGVKCQPASGTGFALSYVACRGSRLAMMETRPSRRRLV